MEKKISEKTSEKTVNIEYYHGSKSKPKKKMTLFTETAISEKTEQINGVDKIIREITLKYIVEVETYSDNGNVHETYTTVNGVNEGEYKQYHHNGTLAVKCTYKGGVLDGLYE